ncbi:MAG: methyltransferase domain-containing protein [Candidatus Krumholzibacteriota bacterium]|nr:methyltransferase domain-containing protein [Candidatus Krumholzibacteriota bacterium]
MAERDCHICPWWLGYLHLGPIRRLMQPPVKLLSPCLEPGMTAIDFGCAMGFFTLDMARLVGPGGRVIAVDIQERSLRTLRGRLRRAGLEERVDVRLGVPGWADDLDGAVDFVSAFYVVHEVPDAAAFFALARRVLVPAGRLFVIEPRGHVGEAAFRETERLALEAGFAVAGRPDVSRSRSVLLEAR